MSFPKKFLFSCSTSSYQIEGAWNLDGKGENIWDRLTHTNPKFVNKCDNGDIACDSYHLYKEDVQLIKDIGFNVYRFSISWARILPNGDTTNINEFGINYYHNLIDELLKNGIQPMVTMYHWDLPQKLQDIGGWMNPLIVDYIEDYADLLFERYGEKVKWWITINEPTQLIRGYEGDAYAPNLNLDSPANYIVGHNTLLSHGRIYRLYDRKYRSHQKGNISMALDLRFVKEATDCQEDIEAGARAQSFYLGWFSHPIYSKDGDYPKLMREIIDKNSKTEKRKRSRLPTFTEEEKNMIKGSFDYFALNNYTARYCKPGSPPFQNTFARDVNVNFVADPKWMDSKLVWLKAVPWGMGELLCWIKKEYNNPPMFITENGYCDEGEINDLRRINYHREYLREVANAIEKHGCNVIGYSVWSLLDNFEWRHGYEIRYAETRTLMNQTKPTHKLTTSVEICCRFGIVYLDFKDANRKRVPKKSAEFFKQLLKTRKIPLSTDSSDH